MKSWVKSSAIVFGIAVLFPPQHGYADTTEVDGGLQPRPGAPVQPSVSTDVPTNVAPPPQPVPSVENVEVKTAPPEALAPAATPAAPPPSPPIYNRWWFWAGVGVVLLGSAATAAYFVTRPPDANWTLSNRP